MMLEIALASVPKANAVSLLQTYVLDCRAALATTGVFCSLGALWNDGVFGMQG